GEGAAHGASSKSGAQVDERPHVDVDEQVGEERLAGVEAALQLGEDLAAARLVVEQHRHLAGEVERVLDQVDLADLLGERQATRTVAFGVAVAAQLEVRVAEVDAG